MRNSLRTRLTIAFIGLAIVPLLFVGGLVGWQSFRSQQEQALNLQRQVAQRVASEVNAFIQERGNELRLLTEIRGLQRLDQAQQSDLLFGLLSAQDVYEELALLDSQGQEKLHLSRLAILSPDELDNRSGAAEFERPKATGETYFSSVWFDEKSGEPFMTIAIPLVDLRSGEFTGALVADFRFKTVQDLMARAEAGDSGTVYVVSEPDYRVIAHRNPTVVLQEAQFEPPDEDGFYPGLDGTNVAMAIEHIKLGEQEFDVVAEKPVAEALSLAINTVYIAVIVIVIFLVVAGVLGFLAARQIVRPIRALASTARAISAGEMLQQVEVTSRDEIGELAEAFNSMTAQLQELIGSLEQRVADRTERLEIVATLSERLSAILDFDQLLLEMVNQVKERFGYYHAHVYIIDEDRQNLVMIAGAGQAGAKMKALGHSIPLSTPTSLVARAARTGEIVNVDNVRETEDWLPNPLLPDTYSEMAVPIILEGQTVGVLDVQEDEIAGLDEGDANLLRSLANHVAVAIRNARLFAEVETALIEAQAAQEQYVEKSWAKAEARQQGGKYRYDRPDAPLLAKETRVEAKQLARSRNQPALVTINGDRSNPKPVPPAGSEQALDEAEGSKIRNPESIVAPVIVSGKTIGTFQLHQGGGDDDAPSWTDEDLALVETVLAQVGQAAENLRLFEETHQRAGREQTIRTITDKLRQAPTLEALVRTASEELSKVLGVSHSLVKVGVREAQPFAENETSQPENGNS